MKTEYWSIEDIRKILFPKIKYKVGDQFYCVGTYTKSKTYFTITDVSIKGFVWEITHKVDENGNLLKGKSAVSGRGAASIEIFTRHIRTGTYVKI
jgi:hypothetical protein